jgi:Protein of unknown function (DUF642)/PEP-CTERM motif
MVTALEQQYRRTIRLLRTFRMTHPSSRLHALVLCASLLAATASHANLLSNPSFESGSFVNQGNDTMSLNPGSTAITGWTVVTDTTAWIGASNPFSLAASDGQFFLDLTNYQPGAPFAGVSQTIATTPGATYSLSFDLGGSNRWGRPDALTASAAGTSMTFTTPTTGTLNDWYHETMSFVATGSSTTLTFQGASGFNYIGLDNVSANLASGPSVPEPTTLSLLGLGIAGIGLARRKRKS